MRDLERKWSLARTGQREREGSHDLAVLRSLIGGNTLNQWWYPLQGGKFFIFSIWVWVTFFFFYQPKISSIKFATRMNLLGL